MSQPIKTMLATAIVGGTLLLPGCVLVINPDHGPLAGHDQMMSAMMAEHHRCMEQAMAKMDSAKPEAERMKEMMERCPMTPSADKTAPVDGHDHH